MAYHATDISSFLTVIGGLLLLGLATDYVGRATALPRVSLLFLFGFLLGPGALGLLPEHSADWMPLIANVALLLVGFLLGGKLTRANIMQNGLVVLFVSVSVVVVTLLVMTIGLVIIGVPLPIALLLGGIATATDPAATMDVITETRSSGRFTNTLQGVVGIDDVWGLLVFSGILALVSVMVGEGSSFTVIGHALWELGGAIGLGIVLGIPMALVSGRIKPGQPTLLEAFGMVMLCGGMAQSIGVSYILSAMVLGIVVANVAKHHERAFHQIEDIEWPFMVLFFTLTGASLNIGTVSQVGWVSVAFIVFRSIARFTGAWPGAVLAGSMPSIRNWMGAALLPQAGVATGMALIAAAQFPDYAQTIIPVVVVATIFFELLGPILTKHCLMKAGETH